MKRLGIVALCAYIGAIFLANYALTHWGTPNPFGPRTVPVWPGIAAPSGVLFVGLAFTFRDVLQDTLGRWWTFAAILVGAAASAVISPSLALASGAAFLLSELADFAVYTPLRDRQWLGAVVVSNVVGFVFDSVLFLWIAFHSLAFLPGQLIGKAWMTALAVALLVPWRRQRFAAA
jgi:uncharacterized PurR-regulated membrane protein YhhQ (DUF165 family)